MATISLCMIVKNEERVLARCLESVQGMFDEIIICDTGSSDSTLKIAGEYTDNICSFEWVDDFSAARNFVFSKATGDYIFWLDADDIITPENLVKLANLKSSINEQTDIVMLPYATAFDENDNPTFTFYRERIIKNSDKFRWQGRVHETINISGNIIYGDAAIYHKSVKSSYSRRNLMIYEKMLKDNEAFSPRDMFYYGRELYYHKEYDKAEKVLNDFLHTHGWVENKIEAYKILSYISTEQNEITKAIDYLTKTFIYGAPRAEVCCSLGYIFKNKEDYTSAVFWFMAALKCEATEKLAFTSKDCYGYIPAIELAVCYDRLGDHKRAESYNELAGAYKPTDSSYLRNKQYFNNIK